MANSSRQDICMVAINKLVFDFLILPLIMLGLIHSNCRYFTCKAFGFQPNSFLQRNSYSKLLARNWFGNNERNDWSEPSRSFAKKKAVTVKDIDGSETTTYEKKGRFSNKFRKNFDQDDYADKPSRSKDKPAGQSNKSSNTGGVFFKKGPAPGKPKDPRLMRNRVARASGVGKDESFTGRKPDTKPQRKDSGRSNNFRSTDRQKSPSKGARPAFDEPQNEDDYEQNEEHYDDYEEEQEKSSAHRQPSLLRAAKNDIPEKGKSPSQNDRRSPRPENDRDSRNDNKKVQSKPQSTGKESPKSSNSFQESGNIKNGMKSNQAKGNDGRKFTKREDEKHERHHQKNPEYTSSLYRQQHSSQQSEHLDLDQQKSLLKQNAESANEPFFAIQKGKANLFLEGASIIYAGAQLELHEPPGKKCRAGDYILVTDYKGNPLGRGFYNPHSLFRVRLLSLVYEKPLSYFHHSLEDTLFHYISTAFQTRKVLLSLPNEDLNAFRLINGEGDRLSGLNIDIFNHTIIVQSNAYWVEKHRGTIEKVLIKLIASDDFFQNHHFSIMWKRNEARLLEDGYEVSSTNFQNPASDQNDSSSVAADKGDSEMDTFRESVITIKENGLIYQMSPSLDQKTGFYCDQRENRFLIQSLVKDKKVLDLYCYTGGFALNALKGGAKEVFAVDSSKNAMNRVEFNYGLNFGDSSSSTSEAQADSGNSTTGVEKSLFNATSQQTLHLIENDCAEQMKKFVSNSEKFDFIILDPPNLAPTKRVLPQAMIKFEEINRLAMSLINTEKGGYLFTFSCAAAMTQSGEFLSMLTKSANSVQRNVKVIKVVGSSVDHVNPLKTYNDNQYFMGVLLFVQ
jgi:23S rRNA G2069 N7-methylase RlmK/C1962 C5-methylase RlmI